MKKIIVFLVTTVTIIPYSAAYVLSYLFSMKDREDMLTPAEWIALYKEYEVEDEEEWKSKSRHTYHKRTGTNQKK